MTRRAKWWTLTAIVGVVAIVGASAWAAYRKGADAQGEKKSERPPLEFTQSDVVQLQKRRLAYQVALPGTIQAVSQATVRAKVAAEVRRVLVREGERVAAGQLLAEFDTAQIRAQLAERAGAVASAQAQLRMTERTRQTNAQLVKQNFISQNAYDSADTANDAQRAAVAIAQAQLEQARIMLNDAVVRAPIAGIVFKRWVQPGEKVGFDAPLVAIVDLAQLEVQAQASVADIAAISTGMRADVAVEGLGGRKVSGRVDRISPSAEPGTRTVNVYVSIRNEQFLIRAGMFARVTLDIAPQNEVSALPVAALRGEQGQNYVWIISAGKLVQRPVSTGARDERAQWVEIVSGLQREDQVLASKFDNLKDGHAAKVVSGGTGTALSSNDVPGQSGRPN